MLIFKEILTIDKRLIVFGKCLMSYIFWGELEWKRDIKSIRYNKQRKRKRSENEMEKNIIVYL